MLSHAWDFLWQCFIFPLGVYSCLWHCHKQCFFFFSLAKFGYFSTKKLSFFSFGKFCFPSVNLTKFANFFLLNFAKYLILKFYFFKKKKHYSQDTHLSRVRNGMEISFKVRIGYTNELTH